MSKHQIFNFIRNNGQYLFVNAVDYNGTELNFTPPVSFQTDGKNATFNFGSNVISLVRNNHKALHDPTISLPKNTIRTYSDIHYIHDLIMWKDEKGVNNLSLIKYPIKSTTIQLNNGENFIYNWETGITKQRPNGQQQSPTLSDYTEAPLTSHGLATLAPFGVTSDMWTGYRFLPDGTKSVLVTSDINLLRSEHCDSCGPLTCVVNTSYITIA